MSHCWYLNKNSIVRPASYGANRLIAIAFRTMQWRRIERKVVWSRFRTCKNLSIKFHKVLYRESRSQKKAKVHRRVGPSAPYWPICICITLSTCGWVKPTLHWNLCVMPMTPLFTATANNKPNRYWKHCIHAWNTADWNSIRRKQN